MPKRSYKGDKRRREIAKKKKREEKLSRKHSGKGDSESGGEDTSYLEYLHPGGLPDEFQDSEEQDDDEDDEDLDDDSEPQ